MRVAILNAPGGAVINLIEADSLARAQQFYPFCRLAIAGDTMPQPPLDPQAQKDFDDSAAAMAYAKLNALIGRTPLAAGMFVAKTNQTFTHTSVGTASPDNVLHTTSSFVIPGGSPGPNGSLLVELEWEFTSSTFTKAFQLSIGRVAISPQILLPNSATNFNWRGELHSTSQVGAVGAQIARGSTIKQASSSTGFTIATAADLSVDQTVLVQCLWNGTGGYTAGELIRQRSLRAWIEFGA